MSVWNTPRTEEEADAIIAMADETLYTMTGDELETACKEIALFAGSFNRVWTAARRDKLIDLLIGVGDEAIDAVLEVLVDIPRAEQFDITKSFIRKLVERAWE